MTEQIPFMIPVTKNELGLSYISAGCIEDVYIDDKVYHLIRENITHENARANVY